MAYMKSGRGSPPKPLIKMAAVTETLPEDIDGKTPILLAAAVFYKRMTATGRRIDKATLSYNKTQLRALVGYMLFQTSLETILENVTPGLINSFIEFRRDHRYLPELEHKRLRPKCPKPHPFCSDHIGDGWILKTGKKSPNAGRAEQIVLSSFVRWCSEYTKWHGSMKGVKRVREQITKTHLSPAEISKVIEASKTTANAGRDYPLTLTAFGTGLRLNELTQLEIGDVIFSNSTIEVRAETAKLKKGRIVPLFPEVAEVLQRYIHTYRRKALLSDPLWISTTGTALSREAVRSVARVLAKRSKVTHFSFHLARHSYAFTSLSIGHDVLSLRLVLGHSSLQETMRYAKGLSAQQLSRMASVSAKMLSTTGPTEGPEAVLIPNGRNATLAKKSSRPEGQKGRFTLVKTGS